MLAIIVVLNNQSYTAELGTKECKGLRCRQPTTVCSQTGHHIKHQNREKIRASGWLFFSFIAGMWSEWVLTSMATWWLLIECQNIGSQNSTIPSKTARPDQFLMDCSATAMFAQPSCLDQPQQQMPPEEQPYWPQSHHWDCSSGSHGILLRYLYQQQPKPRSLVDITSRDGLPMGAPGISDPFQQHCWQTCKTSLGGVTVPSGAHLSDEKFLGKKSHVCSHINWHWLGLAKCNHVLFLVGSDRIVV